MTILGNHDESGMSSLSKEAAEDFAKELKAYADIYGLDGLILTMSIQIIRRIQVRGLKSVPVQIIAV